MGSSTEEKEVDFLDLYFVGTPRKLMEYIGQQICEFCWGTGEVDVMEAVYPNEPHMAPIGTRTCECRN